MANETNINNTQEQGNQPQGGVENAGAAKQENATKPPVPEEKTVSKKLFDEKVSEMASKIKALEAEKRAKMTDDERAAAEKLEMENELNTVKNELMSFKTENALVSAGIKPETARTMSSAIVGGDVSAIVEAIKATIAEVERDTIAKTKMEILENGSPKVPLAGKTGGEVDPNIQLVKNAMKTSATKPLSESKWY